MSVIPCQRDDSLRQKIEEFAEVLKTEAHTLGNHGLSEAEFYNSGLFRGAIERIRGQYSATMREKRAFVTQILNYMQEHECISEWKSSGDANRHDYTVVHPSGRITAIELKGCLDGNNTNIFERPPHAHEFILWSICTNQGADPRHNAWSGIHTRLSAEIILRQQRVDGVVFWDWICGTIGRPCPKCSAETRRVTPVDHCFLPPPCIYVMPSTIASVRNNPRPVAQDISEVHMLSALHKCFGGHEEEINYVDFEIEHRGSETVRKTRVRRAGQIVRESEFTPLQRA